VTAEHAAAAGGEVEALAELVCAARHPEEQALITRQPDAKSPRFRAAAHFDCFRVAEEMAGGGLVDLLAATRQAAADAVLAEARAMCCDADTSKNHTARAEHSRVMAIAERLADAVRGRRAVA
jgi:hypothetical protein